MTGRYRGVAEHHGTTPARDERGAVATEVVVLVPLVVVVLSLMVAGWRLWSARTSITDAASAAARAATLESSGSQAQAHAQQVAAENLAAMGVTCSPLSTSTDTSDFARPPGEPGRVDVVIDCSVPLHDLVLPGLPGSWQVHAVGHHTMDTFRERRP